MIIRTLLLFLMMISFLWADESWFERTDVKIEAGILTPDLDGEISNIVNKKGFASGLQYNDVRSSFFSVDMQTSQEYVPNIYISYFNIHENSDINLDSNNSLHINYKTYSDDITVDVNYNVFNMLLYESFILKGKVFSAFGKKFYSGDLEFKVGVDAKYIDWSINVKKTPTPDSDDPRWIKVNEFIPLPYIGFKYYWYNLRVYGDVSSLSLMEAKSSYAQLGADYRVIDKLYLSVGYVYEDFDIKEKGDTVYFQADGVKVSFKYAF